MPITRFLSVWDMLRFHAGLFMVMARGAGISQALVASKVRDDDEPMGPEGLPGSGYRAMEAQCQNLGLLASSHSARRLSELAERGGATHKKVRDLETELYGRLQDEISSRICLVIELDKAKFYSEPHLFGQDVSERFPLAIVDIEEAGKCLALDRGTACVFHLMRVLEVGLQALEAKLGIVRNKDANWHIILQDVNNAIRALPFSTQADKNARSPYSAAAAHLENVKNAWRNDVMHPRESYTVEQALDIWVHSGALMRSLAAFL